MNIAWNRIAATVLGALMVASLGALAVAYVNWWLGQVAR
jgi:hypothetical protein